MPWIFYLSTSTGIYVFNVKDYCKSQEKPHSSKDNHINYDVYDYSQQSENEYGYISQEAIEDYEEYRRDWDTYMNEYE